ncbi:hypothetical protein LTR36_001492 [Oleoguttula mirabilis]|uniref:SET domain-containing protein n=1 Tax=Oleoguttula mirabilis TaxID=1507867 RepID=A0AAV9JN87_9PEZI|nr:hypothetical protein LTR36_001492 [Oleoguttula mirabilis]
MSRAGQQEASAATSAQSSKQVADSTKPKQQAAQEVESRDGEKDVHCSPLLRGEPSLLAAEGLFAARSIESRSTIFSEAALLTIDVNIAVPNQEEFLAQVRYLSDDQKSALIHLGHHGTVRYRVDDIDKLLELDAAAATHFLIGTFWHFCYPFVKGQARHGLFEWTSFLNHECKPNCELSFNPKTNLLTLRALEDIEEGREVTISYISPYATWTDRNVNLGFFCRCRSRWDMGRGRRARRKFDARESRLESLSEGLPVLRLYRDQWFAGQEPMDMAPADRLQAARAIVAAPETEEIRNKLEELLLVAQKEASWQSELSIIFEVKYLLYMAKSTVTGDEKAKNEALDAKGVQFKLLGRCLGLAHPQVQRAKLICFALLDGNEEGFLADVDELEEFEIDGTLIRAKQRCYPRSECGRLGP